MTVVVRNGHVATLYNHLKNFFQAVSDYPSMIAEFSLRKSIL